MGNNKSDESLFEQHNQRGQRSTRDESIGNQQGTSQTGGQNAGGENRDERDNQYDEDLRNSGNRKSRDES